MTELLPCPRCKASGGLAVRVEYVDYRWNMDIIAVRCEQCEYFCCAPREPWNTDQYYIEVWNRQCRELDATAAPVVVGEEIVVTLSCGNHGDSILEVDGLTQSQEYAFNGKRFRLIPIDSALAGY